MDETVEWVYFGTLEGSLQGIDNELTRALEITEPNTTIRMYLVAKTDCIVYFDVTNLENTYVFGTRDEQSLESDLGNGFKGATSMFTFEEGVMMNVNFGLRWGCETMLNTELRLLVFYVSKNSN